MPRTAPLNPSRTQLLVVDLQEALLPHIHEHEKVIAQTVRMVKVAVELEIPVTISEQNPGRLKRTPTAVVMADPNATRLEKMTFSVLRDETARGHLNERMRPDVLIVGIETQVCIQQTAFDLLEAKLNPYVLADAVGSRRVLDRDVALQRMAASGVVVTTVEAAIFEMLERAGTEQFRRVLPLLK
jgi:nicotinamidase-related amidase